MTTEECLAAARNGAGYRTRFLGDVPVRGKSEAIRAYEVIVSDGGLT